MELESWGLESIIMLTESRIPQMKSRIQVPLTKKLEFSAYNSESLVWNPESKTVLDNLIWVTCFIVPTHIWSTSTVNLSTFFRTHCELV